MEWSVETHGWNRTSDITPPLICIDDPVTGLYATLFPSTKEAIIEPASIVATGVVPAGELQRKFPGPIEAPLYVEYFTRNSRHTIGNCFGSLSEPDPALFTIPSDYTVYSEPADIEKLATMKFNTTESGA